MRKKLAEINGSFGTFSGMFTRYGIKSANSYKPTVLLKNIRNEYDDYLADHMWFALSESFILVGELFIDEKIYFSGRIRVYKKHNGKKKDYRINEVKKILVDERADRHPYPDDEYARYLFIKELEEQNYTKKTGIERPLFLSRYR
jgi:hypothetical protein